VVLQVSQYRKLVVIVYYLTLQSLQYSGVQDHKCDHSSPSSAETEKECSHTSAPPVCLHGVNRYGATAL
jgi:hypothetical protein